MQDTKASMIGMDMPIVLPWLVIPFPVAALPAKKIKYLYILINYTSESK